MCCVLELGDEQHPVRTDDPQQVVEAENRLAPVVGDIAEPHPRHTLPHHQRGQLRPREILGEPTRETLAIDDRGAASAQEPRMRGHIRRRRQFVVVPHHQHTVAGGNQIGFDRISALLDGHLDRGSGVLGAVSARATVRDDERPVGGKCHAPTLRGAALHMTPPQRGPSGPSGPRGKNWRSCKHRRVANTERLVTCQHGGVRRVRS